MRLDKYLSDLWRVSRREFAKKRKKAEITINDKPITKAWQTIQEWDIIAREKDSIKVKKNIYIAIYKPSWYVSSDTPETDYPSYKDLLHECPYRELLHVAWRLDQDTTGLMLASNDGKWVHDIISPKKKLPKTYIVTHQKPLTTNDTEKLTNWITLDDWYLTQPAQIEIIDSITTKLTIHEGKFHQVKRMREAIDNQVLLLHRESIGSYDLKKLQILEGKRQYIK